MSAFAAVNTNGQPVHFPSRRKQCIRDARLELFVIKIHIAPVVYNLIESLGNKPGMAQVDAIQGSKIAKGLQNFQVLVNWDYFYEIFFEKVTMPKKN